MTTSQNGWPVIGSSAQCKKWVIPGTGRHLILAPGAPGLVLAHFALWFHEKIEPLNTGEWDDWGWAYRPIRGSSTISNHASGTAADLNAVKHPMGRSNTFSAWQRTKIKFRLRTKYRGAIVWGAKWSRPDDMHFELSSDQRRVSRVAADLRSTKRGRRLLAANR